MKEGWALKSVKDVALVIAGQSPEGRYYNTVKVGLPFYQGKKEFGEKYIKPSGVWTSVITKKAFAGDILMSVRAPVGPVNVSVEEICIGRGLAAIRQKENVIHDFLYYFFKYYEGNIKGNTGAVFDSINKSQIENIPFLLPPLPEQQRIVSIIDKAFEAIDKAIENTQKNLQNAKELFESYLNSVFEKGGEGWEYNNLDAICVKFDDGNWIESKDQSVEGIRLIQTGNIGLGKFIDKQDKARYISEETFKRLKCTEIYPGDILISRLPDPVGKACQIPLSIKERMITGVDCTIVRLKPNIITHYLLYFQLSKFYLNQVNKLVSGTTRDRISRKNLGIIKVPIAPNSVQQKLVRELDELNGKTNFLQSKYQQKLRDLEELKKSVLNKAFAGEL